MRWINICNRKCIYCYLLFNVWILSGWKEWCIDWGEVNETNDDCVHCTLCVRECVWERFRCEAAQKARAKCLASLVRADRCLLHERWWRIALVHSLEMFAEWNEHYTPWSEDSQIRLGNRWLTLCAFSHCFGSIEYAMASENKKVIVRRSPQIQSNGFKGRKNKRKLIVLSAERNQLRLTLMIFTFMADRQNRTKDTFIKRTLETRNVSRSLILNSFANARRSPSPLGMPRHWYTTRWAADNIVARIEWKLSGAVRWP